MTRKQRPSFAAPLQKPRRRNSAVLAVRAAQDAEDTPLRDLVRRLTAALLALEEIEAEIDACFVYPDDPLLAVLDHLITLSREGRQP